MEQNLEILEGGRERERDRQRQKEKCVCVYVCHGKVENCELGFCIKKERKRGNDENFMGKILIMS